MGNNITLNRSDLYKQVWSTPMSRLAPEYGLSDNSLRKICNILNIPIPPRGYWMRIRHGHKIKKENLSKLKYGEPNEYIIYHDPLKAIMSANRKGDNISSEALELIFSSKKKRHQRKFPLKLTSPHPLVKEYLRDIKIADLKGYTSLRDWRGNFFNLRVPLESLDRALRIMNSLIERFESLGMKVQKEEFGYRNMIRAYFNIFGERIWFIMEEKVLYKSRPLTQAEKKKAKESFFGDQKKWDRFPTGILCFRYEPLGTGYQGIKRRFSDSSTIKLEDFLSDIVISGIKIGDVLMRGRVSREAEKHRQEQERKKKEEEERLRLIEEEHGLKLEAQAISWAKSKQLRDYIAAVEEAASNRPCVKMYDKKLEDWLAWAREHANRLDPLYEGLPIL